MKYIDIHCHLDFSDYGAELSEVLARMKEREVGAITIGTDLESSKRAVKIAEENENTRLPSPEGSVNGGQVWACIGVHPEPSPLQGEGWGEVEEEFEKLVTHPKVVAIGECGLDFFRLKPEELETEKERQEILFRKQIEFALKHDKSLMLHCRSGLRDAYDDTLEILAGYKKEAGEKLRGNAHFFAGSLDQAKRFLDLGFTLSFTGVITFAQSYDSVIKSLPLEKIMAETDAPFVAPVPHRGKRNEPAFVVEVAHKIAEVRGEDAEMVRQILLQNAKRLFGLPN